MQIARISNYSIPKVNFKRGHMYPPTDFYNDNTEQINNKENYKYKPKRHLSQKAKAGIAAGIILASYYGGIKTNQAAIRKDFAEDPHRAISMLTGTPKSLIDEWSEENVPEGAENNSDIKWTSFCDKLDEPVIKNSDSITIEKYNTAKQAQERLADAYCNGETLFLVLKKDTTAADLKRAFGIDNGYIANEEANDIYNRNTVGADINTAEFNKGEVVRVDYEHCGTIR